MKNLFNKKLVLTKEDDEDFGNCNKCWTSDKVRNHCYITDKYRGFTHRGCIINVKLNHKIPIVLHNLKNYDSHLIVQKLGKFDLKINVMPN